MTLEPTDLAGVAPEDARRTDTHERILAVAARLFSERGFAGTSIRDIAEELGVTKAALYYHFPSKDAILGELVGQPLTAIATLIKQAPPLASAAQRVDMIRSVVETMAASNPNVVAVFNDPQLMVAVGAELAQSDVIRDLARALAMGLSGTSDPEVVRPEHFIRAISAVSAGLGAVENWRLAYPDCTRLSEDDKAAITRIMTTTLEG